jgi:hypothetical protein
MPAEAFPLAFLCREMNTAGLVSEPQMLVSILTLKTAAAKVVFHLFWQRSGNDL